MPLTVIKETDRERNSVRDVLSRAVFKLESHGIENFRHEAEQLLSHCLKIESWRLYIEEGRSVNPEEVAEFNRLISERMDHHPLAYIRGWAGFYNLVLKSDERGLIPRPETEILVDRAVALLNQSPVSHPDVVDLGCGSGSISLALAGEHPGANIRGSDISMEALALARENAEDLGLTDSICFRHGDLFDPWEDHKETGFDLILSNPPYLSDKEWAQTPAEVRIYEPAGALRGGIDGLDVIRRLIEASSGYLKPGGHLIFEIGADQGEAVRKLIDKNNELEFSSITRDYSNRDRVVSVCRVIDSEFIRF